jgi:prepilin-type N-terminal cleavage/methylation domain-containing protein
MSQRNLGFQKFFNSIMTKISKLKNKNSGFTFVEVLVAVSVSAVILMSTYGAIQSLFNIVSASRAKIDAVDLANEQIEIIRNMPYSMVGISQGIPNGVLSHIQSLTRDGFNFTVTTFVRNIDDPFDGTIGGTPNDTSPEDYKSVEIDLACVNCHSFTPIKITTTVAPKNLETASTNGALFVKVFDASGNPVVGANVHIENDLASPAIIIDDVTNNQGLLQIVDVPPWNSAYQITVSKSGYSTDKTYLASSTNPHPTGLPATVILQQITQASFSIDKLSSFAVSSVLNSCVAVPALNFSLIGAKNIGTNPIVPKYSQNKVTDANGLLTIQNMEWDSYTFGNIDSSYDLVGVTPLSPISLAPNGSQNATLIVAPKNPDTLLVTVRDKANLLPLSVAGVELVKGAYDNVQMTGQGFLRQTDWSGGSGQATSTLNSNKYFSSDGNVDATSQAGSLILKKVLGQYVANGNLTSSSFDIGFQGTFQQIMWNPGSEPSGTSVKMQIATNSDGGVWNFVGPDGTSSTYYTTSNQNIFTTGTARYLRYKLFFSTTNTTVTPNVSDISFTFTSSCTPPGQVSFSGLAGGNYSITISKAGYVTQVVPVTIGSSWQSADVQMQGN